MRCHLLTSLINSGIIVIQGPIWIREIKFTLFVEFIERGR